MDLRKLSEVMRNVLEGPTLIPPSLKEEEQGGWPDPLMELCTALVYFQRLEFLSTFKLVLKRERLKRDQPGQEIHVCQRAQACLFNLGCEPKRRGSYEQRLALWLGPNRGPARYFYWQDNQGPNSTKEQCQQYKPGITEVSWNTESHSSVNQQLRHMLVPLPTHTHLWEPLRKYHSTGQMHIQAILPNY